MTDDLRDLVTAIEGVAPVGAVRYRQGTIVSVEANGTCTLTISGSTQTVSGIRCASNVCPIPGRSVWLASDGRDLFVASCFGGPAHLSARKTVGQSIADSTWTTVTFPTVDSDPAALYSGGIITAKIPGLYSLCSTLRWPNSTLGARRAYFEVNGSAIYKAGAYIPATSGSHFSSLAWTQALALNDTVTVKAHQNSGAAITLDEAYLTATWLGPAA